MGSLGDAPRTECPPKTSKLSNCHNNEKHKQRELQSTAMPIPPVPCEHENWKKKNRFNQGSVSRVLEKLVISVWITTYTTYSCNV